ncbi:hypothetical protein S40293_09650 [Stachybotrys chartarum IBT 40293]|nr:hypothetical protein S40293_09650 [Stachybotrys chartarum IBT 40293]
MQSFRLRILALYPHLDGVINEEQFFRANQKISERLSERFSDPSFYEFQNAVADKGLNQIITFCRIHTQYGNSDFNGILNAFCDDLFRPQSKRSLECIRNGQDVLFKPYVNLQSNVDKAFIRSFAISMSKCLTENPIYEVPQTHDNKLFTHHQATCLMGPYDLIPVPLYIHGWDANQPRMNAIVTVAECQQGLSQFLDLIPPRTVASTAEETTLFGTGSPAQSGELEDITRRIRVVFALFRGANVDNSVLSDTRHNGLPLDDERLINCSNRMAEAFNVRDLLENWNSEGYAAEFLSTNGSLIVKDVSDIMDAVRGRRNTQQATQSAGDASAHGPDDIPSVFQVPSFYDSHEWNLVFGQSDSDLCGSDTPTEGSDG